VFPQVVGGTKVRTDHGTDVVKGRKFSHDVDWLDLQHSFVELLC